jgi:hypothetical protein
MRNSLTIVKLINIQYTIETTRLNIYKKKCYIKIIQNFFLLLNYSNFVFTETLELGCKFNH